ncbi:hypothetical protein C8Q77DRAFT_291183 [Trametes polyzona]|nr:hypothetical protein C8Q77DRAFT_291183 [Trametes polyzona]
MTGMVSHCHHRLWLLLELAVHLNNSESRQTASGYTYRKSDRAVSEARSLSYHIFYGNVIPSVSGLFLSPYDTPHLTVAPGPGSNRRPWCDIVLPVSSRLQLLRIVVVHPLLSTNVCLLAIHTATRRIDRNTLVSEGADSDVLRDR